jgi:hypothetical protein
MDTAHQGPVMYCRHNDRNRNISYGSLIYRFRIGKRRYSTRGLDDVQTHRQTRNKTKPKPKYLVRLSLANWLLLSFINLYESLISAVVDDSDNDCDGDNESLWNFLLDDDLVLRFTIFPSSDISISKLLG